MAKSNDENDKQQDDQQDQNVQVMRTKDGSTMIQTGPGGVQVNGDLHGGINQSFG